LVVDDNRLNRRTLGIYFAKMVWEEDQEERTKGRTKRGDQGEERRIKMRRRTKRPQGEDPEETKGIKRRRTK
jgi:hypothetical protein